jgi:hypothetical protein
MADFYRVNGTAGPMGTFISFIGKQTTAYGIRIAGASGAANLYNELGPNDALQGILKAISANATILAYQLEDASQSATPANLSVMLEAPATFSATDLQNIIRGGGSSGLYGNTNNIDATSTIVTNKGFKLAYS